MWRWIYRPPRHCLKIGSQELAWAEVRRNWRGHRQFRSAVTALSDGIIRLSPLEPNVLNPGRISGAYSNVGGDGTGGRMDPPGGRIRHAACGDAHSS